MRRALLLLSLGFPALVLASAFTPPTCRVEAKVVKGATVQVLALEEISRNGCAFVKKGAKADLVWRSGKSRTKAGETFRAELSQGSSMGPKGAVSYILWSGEKSPSSGEAFAESGSFY